MVERVTIENNFGVRLVWIAGVQRVELVRSK